MSIDYEKFLRFSLLVSRLYEDGRLPMLVEEPIVIRFEQMVAVHPLTSLVGIGVRVTSVNTEDPTQLMMVCMNMEEAEALAQRLSEVVRMGPPEQGDDT